MDIFWNYTLCFSGADWLGRQTLITWHTILGLVTVGFSIIFAQKSRPNGLASRLASSRKSQRLKVADAIVPSYQMVK